MIARTPLYIWPMSKLLTSAGVRSVRHAWYATARFNAWVTACGWNSAQELSDAKAEAIEYFVKEYRGMLEENLDDYNQEL